MSRTRWWQRTVVKTLVERDPMTDYYRTQHNEWTAAIRAEITAHSPYCSDVPGCGDYGTRLWCAVCRTPWPCRFIRWAVSLFGSEVAQQWRQAPTKAKKHPKGSDISPPEGSHPQDAALPTEPTPSAER